MPVKVKQINEYLFSDTVQVNKTKAAVIKLAKVNTGDIRPIEV